MSRGVSSLVGDTLPVVGMVGVVAILGVVAWQVSSALTEARRVHEMQEQVVASLVAEEAAHEAVERFGANGGAIESVTIASPAGLLSRVEPMQSRHGTRLRIRVAGARDRSYVFQCSLLPGAAPAWMGERLTLPESLRRDRPEVVEWLEASSGKPVEFAGELAATAQLDPKAIRAASVGLADVLVEDDAIGILRLPNGTDRPDFVLGHSECQVVTPRVPFGGVLVVPGNLWVDHGTRPVVVRLDTSLTIVVQGNIYLGRSVAVLGSGHLTLVARRNGATYRDRDGDGSWSAGETVLGAAERVYRGPVEGGGMVYLGLPGRQRQPPARLDLVASVLAEGELYVRAERTAVHGAVIAGFGVTRLGKARLELTGSHLPNIQRAILPGFSRSGEIRPGFLIEFD